MGGEGRDKRGRRGGKGQEGWEGREGNCHTTGAVYGKRPHTTRDHILSGKTRRGTRGEIETVIQQELNREKCTQDRINFVRKLKDWGGQRSGREERGDQNCP